MIFWRYSKRLAIMVRDPALVVKYHPTVDEASAIIRLVFESLWQESAQFLLSNELIGPEHFLHVNGGTDVYWGVPRFFPSMKISSVIDGIPGSVMTTTIEDVKQIFHMRGAGLIDGQADVTVQAYPEGTDVGCDIMFGGEPGYPIAASVQMTVICNAPVNGAIRFIVRAFAIDWD